LLAAIPMAAALHILDDLHTVQDALRDAAASSVPEAEAAEEGARVIAEFDALVASDLTAPAPKAGRPQRWVSQRVEQAASRRLLVGPESGHIAAAMCPGAHEWTHVRPWIRELTLPNTAWRIAVARRLRLPLVDASFVGHPCPTGCGGTIDDLRLTHHFQCKKGGAKLKRHDRVAAVLLACARSARLVAWPATTSDTRNTDKPSSKVDVVINITGIPLNIDVSMVAVELPNITTRMITANTGKRTKHGEPSRVLNRNFTPFILNGLGGLDDDSQNLLKQLAKEARDGEHDEWRRGQFAPFWRARLSVAVQAVMAETLRGSRCAIQPQTDDVSYVGRWAQQASGNWDDFTNVMAASA
jgi:hypothetical protein